MNFNIKDMQNLVLSPIDPDKLIKDISDHVTTNVLKVLKENQVIQFSTPLKNPMDVNLAAEFLGLKKATIYVKVSKNEIPYTRRNGRLYFFRDELIDYLKHGKR